MDEDTRQAFRDLSNTLNRHSDTQGKIFEKVEETNEKLNDTIVTMVERRGEVDRRIDGVEQVARGADEKVEDILKTKKWNRRWILGIVAGVIVAIVGAVIAAF